MERNVEPGTRLLQLEMLKWRDFVTVSDATLSRLQVESRENSEIIIIFNKECRRVFGLPVDVSMMFRWVSLWPKQMGFENCGVIK